MTFAEAGEQFEYIPIHIYIDCSLFWLFHILVW